MASVLRPIEHQPRRPVPEAGEAPRLSLTIVAPPAAAAAALLKLPPCRHLLTITSDLPGPLDRTHAMLVILDGSRVPEVPRDSLWVAWNRTGADAMALAAYERGARVVLPADVDGSILLAALERIASAGPSSRTTGTVGRRSYLEGARIALGHDQVLRVESGIVAQRVIHADGANVLIGLFGAGQIVVGHPDDGCCLDLVAHTDAQVLYHRWEDVAGTAEFAPALRVRLRLMEAWAAAQARPHLDERLLGVLAILGEQFGRPYPRGRLIDVRLTHDQLAAATAATRATVTRALGRLRRRRVVWTVNSGAGRRLCLNPLRMHDHNCLLTDRRGDQPRS